MPSPVRPAVQVPVLHTERLKLRGHRLDDFIASAAMWADPNVTRHIGGQPLTEEEAWTKFLRYVGHWALLGFGYWVVEEKATGSFVGEIGFADYKRDLEPSLHDKPEIGWVLAPRSHGKGYATEAVRAAIAGVMRISDQPRPPASSILRTSRRFGSPRNAGTGNGN